jgi:AdoMet-dependent heme synthase
MGSPRNASPYAASSACKAAGTPSFLIVRVLQACDADCFMCDFRRSIDPYRWSADDALRTANSAARAGITHVRLTGGEPLLHDDILGIVRNLAGESLRVSIITNGGALEENIDALVAAGLDQIIVSLDGPDASHDKFRGTKGLFDAAVCGLRRADELEKRPRLRVNTVAGPHNCDRLSEMHDLLADLNVDDWSIIPLKLPSGPWLNQRTSQIEDAFEAFRAHTENSAGPRLVGDAAAWIGRTPDERIDYLKGERTMTPRTRCGVPERVRYYVPAQRRMYFCNCVPHRTGIDHEIHDWDPDAPNAWHFTQEAAWLEEYGPSTCRGCEPVNAAFGEGRIDLARDPYGF